MRRERSGKKWPQKGFGPHPEALWRQVGGHSIERLLSGRRLRSQLS